jgi:undecaprenyl-diphosphatase
MPHRALGILRPRAGGPGIIEDAALPLLHVVILAVVQGITEFLPISSSGHLIMTWEMFDRFGWQVPENTQSQRLILDVAVHVGTLLAVCLYFWRDIAQILLGLARLLTGQMTPGARLALHVILGSIPLIVVGYLFKDTITETLRDIKIVAWATIGFAVLLLIADRIGLTLRRVEHLGALGALFIGLAQVLALVPGTSRAGITMTAARFLGFERPEAARFSLLLAIPAILGAGTLAGFDLYESGDLRLGFDAIAAAAISFVVAFLSIALMLRWLRRAGFLPFVFYRLFLGAALLIWIA